MTHSDNRLIHIVDDNAFIRDFLTELFANRAYIVECFSSPKEYIEQVNSVTFIKPVATFVDVIMPGMNGYDMMAALQSNHADMKFIIMSGQLDIQSEHKNLACMFLRKPFYPTAVLDVLNKLNRCMQCGPSLDIGCSNADHRGFYDISNWDCPLKHVA